MDISETDDDCVAAVPAGRDIKVSICPRPEKFPNYPYNQGKPIMIIGYQIVQNSQRTYGPAATWWSAAIILNDVFTMAVAPERAKSTVIFPAGSGIRKEPKGTLRPHRRVWRPQSPNAAQTW